MEDYINVITSDSSSKDSKRGNILKCLKLRCSKKQGKSRRKPRWPDKIGHKEGFTVLNIEQIVKNMGSKQLRNLLTLLSADLQVGIQSWNRYPSPGSIELSAWKAHFRSVKIVYCRAFEKRYPTNPVEAPDRVSLPAAGLCEYEFIEPLPASLQDIARVHGHEHIEQVKNGGLYDAAALAAGGAICAAELALQDEPAFALIRPPGHHASANRAWGMCFFNNMAIAVKKDPAPGEEGPDHRYRPALWRRHDEHLSG